MEKKDAALPKMPKSVLPKQSILSFKVRSNLASKDKQNKYIKTLEETRIHNVVNRIKAFNSPQLIYSLNSTVNDESQSFVDKNMYSSMLSDVNESKLNFEPRMTMGANKTFHNFGRNQGKSVNKLSKVVSPIQIKVKPQTFYANHKERDRAIDLTNWISQKLTQIKQSTYVTQNTPISTISLSNLLQYNQTIINYGLGQIIQSVTKHCKEQGQLLKFIWDSTFLLFEGLLNSLAEQIDKKDKEIIEGEKQMKKMYEIKIKLIQQKNQENQQHLQLLYEKMRRIILWNRRLRKDSFKQQIQIRVRDYRLETYSSALQQATSMLLTQSKQPNCLKLAKKIISKLYRQKNMKNKKNRNNSQLYQAKQHVHQTAKQFVLAWLKKYSFAESQKIQNAIFLTQDEKMEIIKLGDQNQIDTVDIYDFFQTANHGVQTQDKFKINAAVQYEKYYQNQMKSVGIQTKRVCMMNAGVQYSNESDRMHENKNMNQSKDKHTNKKIIKNVIDAQHKKNQVGANSHKPIIGRNPRKNNTTVKQLSKNSSNIKLFQDHASLSHVKTHENDIYCQIDETQSIDEWNDKNQYNQYLQELQCKQQQIGAKQIQNKFKREHYNKTNERNLRKNKQQKSAKFKLDGQYIEKNNNDLFQQQQSYSYRPTGKQTLRMIESKPRKRVSSQRFITQCEQQISQQYNSRPLEFKKFQEIYNSQMKKQVNNNKQDLIKTVVRRRSFYKSSRSRNQDIQKSLMYLWYRPAKYADFRPKKQLNQIDEQIYNYFTNLNKTLALPATYPKSKAFQQTCALFSSVSSNINQNTSRTPLPKNKQFITLSVTGIVKFISRLLFDYLRKIRCEIQGISMYSAQPQKIYSPLSMILVDHMMHQYGLREIAQKKLKDFVERLGNFLTVSERIAFIYRLIGIGQDGSLVGVDQLLIYMKCLVLFDTSRVIPVNNGITKDFTIQRIVTDKQTVLAHVDQIINEFYRQDLRKQVKWRIQRYFHIYQLTGVFDVEKIASMLIEEFIAIKKNQYDNYLPLYKNCSGNFFPNLKKIIQIYNGSDNLPLKSINMLQQIYKGADLIDENNWKSISEVRFIGLCVRLGFPKYSQLQNKLNKLKDQFINNSFLKQIGQQCTMQGEQMVNKIKKKYNIKIGVDKQASNYWNWTCAQLSYDVTLINAYEVLGHLKLFKNKAGNTLNF